MKALNKRRATPAQRQMITDAVVKEYEKIKSAHEKKINERVFFIHYLALAITAEELLGFGDTRRDRLVEACISKSNELSQELVQNKCTNADGVESFDSDYNRSLLEKLAKQCHLKFDESIFDDDFEETE